MTDDLVARLRHEQELCAVMGDGKAGALVGEAADRLEALEIKERESFQQYVDANEARIEAEARVRELEAELAEAYERCAQAVHGAVTMIPMGQVDASEFLDVIEDAIAAAIRQLAQEVKHEAD